MSKHSNPSLEFNRPGAAADGEVPMFARKVGITAFGFCEPTGDMAHRTLTIFHYDGWRGAMLTDLDEFFWSPALMAITKGAYVENRDYVRLPRPVASAMRRLVDDNSPPIEAPVSEEMGRVFLTTQGLDITFSARMLIDSKYLATAPARRN